jgi:hypothetical protein
MKKNNLSILFFFLSFFLYAQNNDTAAVLSLKQIADNIQKIQLACFNICVSDNDEEKNNLMTSIHEISTESIEILNTLTNYEDENSNSLHVSWTSMLLLEELFINADEKTILRVGDTYELNAISIQHNFTNIMDIVLFTIKLVQNYPFEDNANWIIFDANKLRNTSNTERIETTHLIFNPIQNINPLRDAYGDVSMYSSEVAYKTFSYYEELKKEALLRIEQSIENTNAIIQNYLVKENTYHISLPFYIMIYHEFLLLKDLLMSEKFINRRDNFDVLCLNLVVLFNHFPISQERGWFEFPLDASS